MELQQICFKAHDVLRYYLIIFAQLRVRGDFLLEFFSSIMYYIIIDQNFQIN